ncbi:MAG: hypothetical protein KBS79_01990, partial [Lachnospiraceae bacterium]|nr:hypothetical protein [Candidatus Minthocola equi]
SSAFSGDYGVDGTLTVENALGKITTEGPKSNFRYFEVGKNYNVLESDTKVYFRPGAVSMSLTFSDTTGFRTWADDTAYIYNGRGELVSEYQHDELRNKTIDIQGDTVTIHFVPSWSFDNIYGNTEAVANGYKVVDIKATYPDSSGFTLSSGNWWIIGGASAVAIAAVVTLIVVTKKKKKAA